MKQFSVILPLVNEEKVFEELYSRVKKTMDSFGTSYEIIFVDDGSKDLTSELIFRYGKKDHNVVGVKLSRNFGQDNAIIAGLKVSSGQDIVLLDGDLQDPPEKILNLVDKKNEGYDVVYGINTDRKEGLLITGLTSLFYQFMFFLSGTSMPRNVGTFSVFSRQVGEAILQFAESNKFFSGLRHHVGFKQTGVYYKREKRTRGKSKSFVELTRMAMNSIFSFYSMFPMRLVICFVLIVAISTVFLFLIGIYQAIEGYVIIDLSAYYQPLIILIIGVVLLILIMIAEVVGRIDAQVKQRPDFVVESIIQNGVVVEGSPAFSQK